MENPYTTPQTEAGGLPDAPDSHGWEIHGKVIQVGPGAQFPMIDPYTGVSEDPMRMQLLQIRQRPLWLWGIPILGTLGGLLQGLADGNWIVQGLMGLILGLAGRVFVGLFFPRFKVRAFFQKRTIKFRNMLSGILGLCFLISFFGGIFLPHHLGWIAGTAFVIWILGITASLLFNRQLRCRRKSGGLFELRGFHPLALEQLRRYADARGGLPSDSKAPAPPSD